ncbi:MAG: DUF6062 family protein [Oscillospiraceae bacterium]|jgi:hypothetical protein|nr:DUF6062 family protein [Oscillospiraceae bacterium]
MRETIYTIPINEAFEAAAEHGDGCAVCALRKGLEGQKTEYIMGAAMMEPDVRERTNALGFCRRHLAAMLAMRNRLSLSLMLQTHIDTLRAHPEKRLAPGQSCFVCESVQTLLDKYYSNMLYMWGSSADFRALCAKAPPVCMRCASGLWEAAGRLPKKQASAVRAELSRRARERLDALYADISLFCKSFDHRFAGMELGDAATAAERSADFLQGEAP